MSASEVAPNPFWYAKPTAALSSRDRLSICVLAMCVSPSTNLGILGVEQICQALRRSAADPSVIHIGWDHALQRGRRRRSEWDGPHSALNAPALKELAPPRRLLRACHAVPATEAGGQEP